MKRAMFVILSLSIFNSFIFASDENQELKRLLRAAYQTIETKDAEIARLTMIVELYKQSMKRLISEKNQLQEQSSAPILNMCSISAPNIATLYHDN